VRTECGGGRVVGRAYQPYQQPPEIRNELFSVHNMKVSKWHRGTAPLIHNPVQMPGIIEDENFLSMLRTEPRILQPKDSLFPAAHTNLFHSGENPNCIVNSVQLL